MLETIFRNLSVSRVNNGRARAPHSKSGRLGVCLVRNFRGVSVTLSSRCGVSEVLRNEFLRDVSSRFPRLFGVTVPFHVELQRPIRRHTVFE